MFSKLITFGVVISIALLAGCTSVEFEHPLVKPENSVAYPELYGAYLVDDEIESGEEKPDTDNAFAELDDDSDKATRKSRVPTTLTVGSPGKGYPRGFMKIVYVGAGDDDEIDYFAFTAFGYKIDDYYVIHMPQPKQRSTELTELKIIPKKWQPDSFENYSLFALRKSTKGWAIHEVNERFLDSAIGSKKVEGWVHPRLRPKRGRITSAERKVRAEKEAEEIEAHGGKEAMDILVSAKTEELRKLIESNKSGFFGNEPIVELRRLK
ncbi:MAG: hypothetical protein AB8B55_07250 [Mariniblastus sp.]